MNARYPKAVMAVMTVMLMSGMSAQAAVPVHVSNISGEVTWVDIKVGKLQLKSDAKPDTAEVSEYRISKDETRVASPLDKKFLTIEDLQAGQHVTVDVIDGQEDKIVQKITAESMPVSDFQIALGELQSIDLTTGTMVILERPRIGEEGTTHVSQFVFEPNNLIVLQSPSMRPVPLALNAGDVVKVEYSVIDGKRHMRSVTLYVPKTTSTTTTTTTTITR